MAETLYLKYGTCEVVIGEPAAFLQNLIEQRLGRDCAEMFQSIAFPGEQVEAACDDFERMADGYLQELHSVMEELDSILEKPRLSRQALENLRKELYNNL